MNKKNQIPTFLSLVIRFSVIFILVVMAIEIIFQLFKSGNLNAVIDSFNDNTWIAYIAMKFSIAIVYGVFMAYLTQKRLKKQNKS